MEESSSRNERYLMPILRPEHENIPLRPPEARISKVGNLLKRRGGFARIASPSWKKRHFVLFESGDLAYFESGASDGADPRKPPRGFLTLDEGVNIQKFQRSDGDGVADFTLVIHANGQRWKLGSEVAGDIDLWEQALKSMQHSRSSNGTRGRPVQSLSLAVGAGKGAAAIDAGIVSGGSPGRACVTENDTGRSMCDSTAADVVPDGVENPGVQTFFFALAALDAVCYFLHTAEASIETFFAAIILVNLVVGVSFLRRTPPSGHQGVLGVPLIHDYEVASLRCALKKRFPVKQDPPSLSAGDVGDGACGVPIASSTMQRYDGQAATPPPHSWTNSDRSVFRLRGKGYLQDKVKVVPGEVLYDVVGVDLFATEARIGNIASEVVMDSITKDLPQVGVPGVPPILVLNVQLPSASPALMSAAEDGPGYQCVYYYRIKESTVSALENLDTASEAVRLWVRYCHHMGVDDEYHGRFKCICVIANYERLGIPNVITKYNGKPVLINKSGNWFRGANYVENDINVHRFSFIAKRGLHSLKGVFKHMVLHVGFTIEGHRADELPESLVGCCTLNYPSLDKAVEFDI